MQTKNEEDAELIAGICLGDEAALRALLKKYLAHLYRFAFWYLRRHDLAKEAVANVFIKIWQRRQTLVINTNVSSYLYSAVSNHSHKLLRTELRPEEISIEIVPPEELVEDVGTTPELRYREWLEQIEVFLKTMPLQRRRIFKMSRIENLRYTEIAEVLGISVNIVQKQMGLAKRQIAAIRDKLDRELRRDTGPG